MRRLLPLAAVSACIVAVGTSCGSDAASGQALSIPAWTAKANAICRRTGLNVKRTPRPATFAQVQGFIAATAPIWKRELDEIRALAAPDEIAVKAEVYSTAESYFTQALVEVIVAAQRGDERRTEDSFAKASAAVKDMRVSAEELGIRACARRRMP